MHLKFMVDECIHRPVYNWLREHYDALYAADEMMGARDIDVLREAIAENRIIVTADKDFGDLVFRDKNEHVGIILIRLTAATTKNQLLVLQKILDLHSEELINNFVIATEATIKVIKGMVTI